MLGRSVVTPFVCCGRHQWLVAPHRSIANKPSSVRLEVQWEGGVARRVGGEVAHLLQRCKGLRSVIRCWLLASGLAWGGLLPLGDQGLTFELLGWRCLPGLRVCEHSRVRDSASLTVVATELDRGYAAPRSIGPPRASTLEAVTALWWGRGHPCPGSGCQHLWSPLAECKMQT
jgi:hypothetical protein